MNSIVLFGFRIALLVVLWLLVLIVLRVIRRDMSLATGRTMVASTSNVVAPQGLARSFTRSSPARLLAVVDGPLAGTSIEVTDEIVMGRSPSCTLALGDDYASARHARLFKRGDEWIVEDLDSRNGTFVNGFRIDQPETVGLNTDIRIGRTTVRLVP